MTTTRVVDDSQSEQGGTKAEGIAWVHKDINNAGDHRSIVEKPGEEIHVKFNKELPRM